MLTLIHNFQWCTLFACWSILVLWSNKFSVEFAWFVPMYKYWLVLLTNRWYKCKTKSIHLICETFVSFFLLYFVFPFSEFLWAANKLEYGFWVLSCLWNQTYLSVNHIDTFSSNKLMMISVFSFPFFFFFSHRYLALALLRIFDMFNDKWSVTKIFAIQLNLKCE